MDSKIFILYLACSFIGMVLAADIQKCFSCSGSLANCTKGTEQVCAEQAAGPHPGGPSGAPGATTVAATAAAQQQQVEAESGEATTEAEGARLVERDEAGQKFKCLKIVKNGTDVWKGCGASCDASPEKHEKDVCSECDDKDLCNLAIRINSIGWIFALVVIICFVGVRY